MMETNKRLARTKRDFKNAVIKLLNEKKDIHEITIIDIVEEAQYNRGTFYLHYSNKQALLNEIMIETIEGFIKAFQGPYKHKNVRNLRDLPIKVIEIFNYVEKNAISFSLLFNSDLFPGFQKQLYKALEEVFKDFNYVDELANDINCDLYIRKQVYSIYAMIDYWIECDFSYSSEYMTDQLMKMSNYTPLKIKVNE